MSQSEDSLIVQSMFENCTVNVVVPKGEPTEREDGVTLIVGVTPDWVTFTSCANSTCS